MPDKDLLYFIALTMVPHIGDIQAKMLLKHFGTPDRIFKAKKSELEKINGIGKVRASSIHGFRDYRQAEAELKFIDQYRIRVLIHGQAPYPVRLNHCYDSPFLLFFKGNADLDHSKIISIIGTRTPTDYGKERVKEIVQAVSGYQPLIVSGLAYGIDTCAHKAALKNQLNTVGILAHGLDRIYPPANKNLAREMVEQGGLLTEFTSGKDPDAQNFPMRNRIVAGLTDAVIVIETGVKGGSMITADIANSYNIDVCALPGRITDSKSEGCNLLIRENKAQLITGGNDIIRLLNWDVQQMKSASKQIRLFPDLTAHENGLLEMIRQAGQISIDTICSTSTHRPGEIAAALLSLEMIGAIRQLPGKWYAPA